MSGYEDAPEVSFGEGALTAEQCFARARRALERAEEQVDEFESALGGDAEAHEIIALADSRSFIAKSWTELGAALRRAER